MSTGKPAQWASDLVRMSDVLDTVVTKSISPQNYKVEGSLGLKSDHAPMMITLICANEIPRLKAAGLCSKETDWLTFREYPEQNINCKTPDGDWDMNKISDSLSYHSYPESSMGSTPSESVTQFKPNSPAAIKTKINEKGRLRKWWRETRRVGDKTKLNKAIKELKSLLTSCRTENIQQKLRELSDATNGNSASQRGRPETPTKQLPPLRRLRSHGQRENWSLSKSPVSTGVPIISDRKYFNLSRNDMTCKISKAF